MREIVTTKADICHRADHIRKWFIINQLYVIQDYVLADRVGCDRKVVGQFRNGYRNTGIDTVEAMLNELGYTLTIEPLKERR